MIDISRRGLILGAASVLVTAPAIVRATSIMKVKPIIQHYAGDMSFASVNGEIMPFVYMGNRWRPYWEYMDDLMHSYT